MGDRDWLQNLKVGDKVIISGGTLTGPDAIGTVTRFTNNFIIVSGKNEECKFRRESGYQAGDHGYYNHYLREATQERLDTIILKAVRSNTRIILDDKTDWNEVPLEILKQLQELVKPYRKEEKI